jgi:MFS family permease
MAAEGGAAAPGAHAPLTGNAHVVALSLCIPVLVAMMALAIVPGALQMSQEFGALTAQLVLVLPAFVMIFGAAVSGYLSERWGRRAVIAALLVLYGVSGGIGFVAPNLPVLVASRIAIGFAGGALLTTVYAVIGEYFEGHARERLLGFMSTAASAASVAMLALGGEVVEAYGWRAPFLLYLAGLLLVPSALAGLRKGLAVSGGQVKVAWGPVLRWWPIYLLLMAYTVGMYMMAIQGPFLLGAKGITAPSTIGLLVAVSSIFGALGGFLYGYMRKVFGFRAMFVWISVCVGIGLPLAAWAPGQEMFILAAFITGLGIGVIEPTVASELLLRTPEPLHDRAMGLNVAAMFLGQFLNPYVVLPLREAQDIGFAFQAIGVAYLAGGLLFLLAMVRGGRCRAAAA